MPPEPGRAVQARQHEAKRSAVPEYRLGAFVFHYAPLLLPLFFAAMQQIMHAVEYFNQPQQKETFFESVNWGGEFLYAILGFWVWALSTNVVSARILDLDPPDPQDVEAVACYARERKNQLAAIGGGMLVTVLCWALCLIPRLRAYNLFLTILPLATVIYVRRSPHDTD